MNFRYNSCWSLKNLNLNTNTTTMFPSLIRRAAQQGVGRNIPYIYTNTFKAKRAWPPDFEKIPTKLQFRLERKYKRRSKLKWARPKWVKAVKMVQYGSVLCMFIYGMGYNVGLMLIVAPVVMIYGVLFLDWNTGNMGNPEHPPFQGVWPKIPKPLHIY